MLNPLGKFGSAETPISLPHNIEAEQALLGALLLDNRAFERVSEIVTPVHFHEPLHGRVFELIGERIQAGRLASPMSFKAEFEHAKPLSNGLTVIQYLGQLVARASTIIGARDYAMTIRELASRRELISIGEEIARGANEAGAEDAAAGIIEEAESRLFELAEKSAGSSGGVVSFGEAAKVAVARIERAWKKGGGLQGLSTGLSDLDAKLGGLQRSDLIILAARPSMGKTALVTNIAWSIARNTFVADDGDERQAPVGFFSLEMSAEQLAGRLISAETGIPGHILNRGNLNGLPQMEAVIRKSQELARTPLFIDDRGGISIAQLCARARRMKRKHGIELLIVDYLQLLSGSKKERVQELTQITTGLKALAKELAIPVIALSQLNRDLEKRTDKRPQLSDLRESGSIEQDADVVLFVYREEYYWTRENPKPDERADEIGFAAWREDFLKHGGGLGEIIIGKQRHGPIGTVTLAFDGETTKFSSLGREASS
jgi:replicative DNA helicase